MKRLLMVAMVISVMSITAVGTALGASVLKMKSGLSFIDSDLTQPGYPMFFDTYDGRSMIMIDLYGNMVHHWTTKGLSFAMANNPWPLVLENGNLVVDSENNNGGGELVAVGTARGSRGFDALIELDWDSNLVADTGDSLYAENYAPHHDGKKIWNKSLNAYTWLSLIWQAYGPEDAVALGADPIYEEGYTGSGSRPGWSPDGLVEVDQDGNLVWRWSFADHIVQNYDPSKTTPFTDAYGYANPGATYGEAVDYPGKLNINFLNDNQKGPEYDWNHCNSMDYNPALGHIVVNAKDMSEAYIIDHDGTFVSTEDFTQNWEAAQSDAGDFLYRFGNPHNYGRGEFGGYMDAGDHQFFGAHNVQWIGASSSRMYPGFEVFGEIPGEGNLMLFDNNCWDPTERASNVLEWNPFIMDADLNVSGTYVDPPDAGYQSGSIVSGGTNHNGSTSISGYSSQVVWRFNGGTGFYSYFISGAHRMPNGNTHVCEGGQGHLFEVTEFGQVAWEYFMPGSDAEFSGGRAFRSNKLPVGHPALEGRDLSPKGNFRQILVEDETDSAAAELQKFLGVL